MSPDISDPVPASLEAGGEPTERSTAVWREWLASMAKDAEAALAAAIAYRDMDATGRERWLDSLASDSLAVDVPRIALYAPLLSVETDPERRLRLLTELGDDVDAARPKEKQRGFSGHGKDGFDVHVLVLPLYLDFVQVLACGTQQGRFVWVRHDPIVSASGAPRAFQQIEGVRLETMPVKSVLDELAKTVLSHRRQGLELQEALLVLVDLLGAQGP